MIKFHYAILRCKRFDLMKPTIRYLEMQKIGMIMLMIIAVLN
jgi:hypothetical protein